MPALFVVVSCCTLVASFTTMIWAPAIVAPDGSRTIPLMVALGDCAIAGATHNRLRMRRKLTSRTFFLPWHTDSDTPTVSTLEIPTLVPLPRHERTTQIVPNG